MFSPSIILKVQLSFFCVTGCNIIFAQLNPTSIQTNFDPSYRLLEDTSQLVLTLPSLTYSLYTPDFKIASMLQTNSDGVLNTYEISHNRIKDRNRIYSSGRLSTINLSNRVNNRFVINFQHSFNILSSADIDGQLFKIAFEGLDNFVNKSVNLHTSLNANLYSEMNLSSCYKISDRIYIGLGLKYLTGVSSLLTKKGDNQIYFENYNYAMSFYNDIDFRIYALEKMKDLKYVFKSILSTKNVGMGVDLALSYRLKKYSFNIGVVDLFSNIRWNQDGTQLISQGSHYFGGVDPASTFIQKDKTSNLSIKDTLMNTLGIVKNSEIKTYQKLNTQLVFNCLYQLTTKTKLGVILHQNFIDRNTIQKNWSFIVKYKISKSIELGSSLNIRDNRFFTFGSNVIARFKKLQIILATDNINSLFMPYNNHIINGYMAVQMIFTNKKYKQKLIGVGSENNILLDKKLRKYLNSSPKIDL